MVQEVLTNAPVIQHAHVPLQDVLVHQEIVIAKWPVMVNVLIVLVIIPIVLVTLIVNVILIG